jgi:trehalose 6-phosphate synthase
MGRLVCVSPRLPLGPTPSGGLAVALKDALEGAGGLWIGSAGVTAAPEDGLREIAGNDFRRLAFDLSEAEQEGYYSGFANSVLWPVFHARTDLARIQAEQLAMYRAVNARVARLVAGVLDPQDRLWVHDFHFLPLAHELRVLGVRNRIGFFLHTPFPAPDDMGALPNGEEVCRPLGWRSRASPRA